MANMIWMVLALASLAGMFAICVVVVVMLVRWLEGMLARRAGKSSPT